MKYQTSTHAFVGQIRRVLAFGDPIVVRNSSTAELLNESFEIVNPRERYIVVPHRLASPASAIAETMWVLAGRNDLEFLARYLPRAAQFSDDGRVWHGAYGPRIRDWGGVDQLAEVVRILRAEPTSRRAVISLFDPSRDFVDSRDIPCNNWLQFTIRRNSLHMAVVLRSNDLVWGFSGINSFEWSVLQEIVARWLDVEIGSATYFVGSAHVYERHFERVHKISSSFSGATCYDEGPAVARYEGREPHFADELREWFRLEEMVRTDPTRALDLSHVDPLFKSFVSAVQVHWAIETRLPASAVEANLAALAGSDAEYAMREYWSRKGGPNWSPTPVDLRTNLEALKSEMIALHAEKATAYGDSWKRRGELVGILGNIARKVDRIERIDAGAPQGSEPSFETWLDLCIYLLKYETYLHDLDPGAVQDVLPALVGRASEGTEGFERLLRHASPSASLTSAEEMANGLARLEVLALEGASALERYEETDRMFRAALAITLSRFNSRNSGDDSRPSTKGD